MAMAEMPGPYDVRAYVCVARGVATHTCPMAPYRGVSRPVITLAMERLMDKAAATFDLGPDEIRRRNLIRRFPYTSATGLVFDEGSYLETLAKAVAHVDLSAFAPGNATRVSAAAIRIGLATFPSAPATAVRLRGRGMAITPGWETVELTMILLAGSKPHRRQPARPGSPKDSCATDRRRGRRRAARRAVVHGETAPARLTAGTSASRRWSFRARHL